MEEDLRNEHIEIVIAMMKEHENKAFVQSGCLSALMNVITTAAVAKVVEELEAVPLVLEALKKYYYNQRIMIKAITVVKALCAFPDIRKSIITSKYRSTIKHFCQ